MDMQANSARVESSLIQLGIVGAPLDAIMAIIQVHIKPDISRQVAVALDRQTNPRDLGEVASFFLKGSLKRKEMLGSAVDDTAWNIMLALFAGEQAGSEISVTSACHASGSAPTTALRHVAALIESGLVERTPDWRDARRSFLTLSKSASSRMAEFVRGFCIAPPQNGGRPALFL